jgi:hypothetical protein
MKMLKGLILLTLICVVSIPVYAECSAAEAAALEALDRSWGEMSRAGDRAALEAILAPEYSQITAVGATGRAKTLDDVVADAAQQRNRPARWVTTHDHYVITCTPNTATISHRNVITPAAGGVPSYNRSLHFLEKRGGKYVVVSSTFLPVTDETQIEYLEREWSDADTSGKPDWYAANLADDYRGVASRDGAMRTKQDELNDAAATLFTSGKVADLHVDVQGDMAVATGLWTGSGMDKDKKPFTRTVRYTDTYMKRDGRWVAVASQGTIVVPK